MKPRMLDIFCCGGGSAMGWSLAGFDVVGVDHEPQPKYPFPIIVGEGLNLLWDMIRGKKFIASDGREYGLSDFDAVSGSPPCQGYSVLKHLNKKKHPMLIEACRDVFMATGLPYTIENVPGAPLNAQLMLCGTMFGLRTPCGAELQRHRYFEMNWWQGFWNPVCNHGNYVAQVAGGKCTNPRIYRAVQRGLKPAKARVITIAGHVAEESSTAPKGRTITVTGDHARAESVRYKRRIVTVTGHVAQQNTVNKTEGEYFSADYARIAMGIGWLTMKELSQAIPPAYTEFIGRELMGYLRAK